MSTCTTVLTAVSEPSFRGRLRHLAARSLVEFAQQSIDLFLRHQLSYRENIQSHGAKHAAHRDGCNHFSKVRHDDAAASCVRKFEEGSESDVPLRNEDGRELSGNLDWLRLRRWLNNACENQFDDRLLCLLLMNVESPTQLDSG